MKARATLRFQHGWRLPRHLQGGATKTGYLFFDEVKPRDLGRRVKRLRLLDEGGAASLFPDLLSPRELANDGDARWYEGFEAYQASEFSNVIWVLQMWELAVLDALATVQPPAPEVWPRPTEVFYFTFIDQDGIECRSPHKLTREEAQLLPAARCMEDTRESRWIDKNGAILHPEHSWMNRLKFDGIIGKRSH